MATFTVFLNPDNQYHSLSDLFENLELEQNKTYALQTIGNVQIKEGDDSTGFFSFNGKKEFQFKYEEDDLYFKAPNNKVIITIS